jgi:hypothetical protein
MPSLRLVQVVADARLPAEPETQPGQLMCEEVDGPGPDDYPMSESAAHDVSAEEIRRMAASDAACLIEQSLTDATSSSECECDVSGGASVAAASESSSSCSVGVTATASSESEPNTVTAALAGEP